MKLIYTPKLWVAPPAGWPARDHDEPDGAVAEAKMASRFYRSESGVERKQRTKVLAEAKRRANVKAAERAEEEAEESEQKAQTATAAAEQARARARTARTVASRR